MSDLVRLLQQTAARTALTRLGAKHDVPAADEVLAKLDARYGLSAEPYGTLTSNAREWREVCSMTFTTCRRASETFGLNRVRP